jgi:hypothetical protein
LIPLVCIRPLRLCLPAETLRRVRIVVLKSTHLPFVAIIWAYENSRRFISQRVLPQPSTALPKSPGRPLSACQAGVGHIRAASRSTLLAPTTPTREPQVSNLFNVTSPTNPAATTANVADLVGLVQKLSSQVEELTSMVAGQQKD